MIIYPARNSSAVLVGALFFDTAFPSFIGGIPSPISPVSPLSMQQISRQPQYAQQRISNIPYGSSPHRHAPSLSPHHSDNNSPIEQTIAMHNRQDPYRYMVQRPGQVPYNPMEQPSSSSDMAWSNVKDEDENGYAAYTQHHPPYS